MIFGNLSLAVARKHSRPADWRSLCHSMALGLATLFLLCGPDAYAGIVSPLYITTNFNTGYVTHIVQGFSVTSSFTNPSGHESAIAVWDDIRTFGDDEVSTGSKYDLYGNLISPGIYTPPAGTIRNYDGTTDGTYNYAIDAFKLPTQVMRYDRDWANGAPLFTTTRFSSGITYDTATNTLWTLQLGIQDDVYLQNYDMSGTLLSDTLVAGLPGTEGFGLAYDPADETLWTWSSGESPGKTFWQLDRTGTIQDSFAIGLFMFLAWTHTYGGEFNLGPSPIPEPSTYVMATLGLLGLGLMSWRRKGGWRRKRAGKNMAIALSAIVTLVFFAQTNTAQAITIDWADIGDVGNPPDVLSTFNNTGQPLVWLGRIRIPHEQTRGHQLAVHRVP